MNVTQREFDIIRFLADHSQKKFSMRNLTDKCNESMGISSCYRSYRRRIAKLVALGVVRVVGEQYQISPDSMNLGKFTVDQFDENRNPSQDLINTVLKSNGKASDVAARLGIGSWIVRRIRVRYGPKQPTATLRRRLDRQANDEQMSFAHDLRREGDTWEKISKDIRRRYGIDRRRQATTSMYKRWCDRVGIMPIESDRERHEPKKKRAPALSRQQTIEKEARELAEWYA